jgi:hypothetical protein
MDIDFNSIFGSLVLNLAVTVVFVCGVEGFARTMPITHLHAYKYRVSISGIVVLTALLAYPEWVQYLVSFGVVGILLGTMHLFRGDRKKEEAKKKRKGPKV